MRKDEIMRLEVLRVMLEMGGKYRKISTADIQEKLFGNRASRSPERRKLQRLLNSLEYVGYLESEGDECGRRGKQWKINKYALKGLEYLSEEERRRLLLSYVFLPLGYKDEFVEKIKDALSRVSGGEGTGNVLGEYIGKYIEFEERYAKADINTLTKIVEALEKTDRGENIALKFHYKGKFRIVVPLKLFSYEGLIQLAGWELSDEKATKEKFPKAFIAALIKGIEVIKIVDAPKVKKIYEMNKKNINEISEKLRKSKNFPTSGEKPFIFGVKLGEIDEYIVSEDYKISPLQICKIKNSKAVLIGYTSSRYAFRFLNIRHIKEILKPTKEVFEYYSEKAIKEGYEDIPKSFEENINRFNEFLVKLRRILDKKYNLLLCPRSNEIK